MHRKWEINWFKATNDEKIAAQIKAWGKEEPPTKEKPPGPFLTISREFGARGFDVARRVVDKINRGKKPAVPWLAYDKELVRKVSEDHNILRSLALLLDENVRGEMEEFFDYLFRHTEAQVGVFRQTAETIRTLAIKGNVIIVGRGGCFITGDLPNGFHIRMIAPLEFRIDYVSKSRDLGIGEARKLVRRKDRERNRFVHTFLNENPEDPHLYELTINVSKIAVEEATDIIFHVMQARGYI